MILLDTNIISEVMRANPAANVLAWLDAQETHSMFISTVTIGEIAYGLRIMPTGKRRDQLGGRFSQFVALGFTQRILSYDESAARAYGDIMATRKEVGRPMSVPDGQIAGIARANNLGLATRNLRDFEHCGIALVDPFTTSN